MYMSEQNQTQYQGDAALLYTSFMLVLEHYHGFSEPVLRKLNDKISRCMQALKEEVEEVSKEGGDNV